LDDDTWLYAPGARDPINPGKHLTLPIIAGRLRRDPSHDPDRTPLFDPDPLPDPSTFNNPHADARSRAAGAAYDAVLAAGLSQTAARTTAKRAWDALAPKQTTTPSKKPKPSSHETPAAANTSPLRRIPDTTSTPTSRAYNKVVDQFTVQVIADYFASIPTIFGLIQNNLSTQLSQALNRDPEWLDAVRRKDLVCAWYTLIEASLFKRMDRDTSISQLEAEINSSSPSAITTYKPFTPNGPPAETASYSVAPTTTKLCLCALTRLM
jgi:hypothetical protein